MNKPTQYKSILIPEHDSQIQPPSKQYTDLRKQSLQSLSDKYKTELNCNNVGKSFNAYNNPKLHYYMDKYQTKRQQVQNQKRIRQAYLRSEQFETVFGDCIEENQQKERERRQMERIKRQMQRKFGEHYQQPEHDDSIRPDVEEKSEEQVRTVLMDYRQDPNKQKELYLIDLELGRMKFEENIDKKIQQKREMCNNEALMSRMSKNILSAYMVNFDEIFKELIDQILEEEALFLNYIEANYHINEKHKKEGYNEEKLSNTTNNIHYQQVYQNNQTIQMMQLVKQLQDLCDDDRNYLC